MRYIVTNRTIGVGCFSIGTNGDPSYHHLHQWSLFVSIGQPSGLRGGGEIVSLAKKREVQRLLQS